MTYNFQAKYRDDCDASRARATIFTFAFRSGGAAGTIKGTRRCLRRRNSPSISPFPFPRRNISSVFLIFLNCEIHLRARSLARKRTNERVSAVGTMTVYFPRIARSLNDSVSPSKSAARDRDSCTVAKSLYATFSIPLEARVDTRPRARARAAIPFFYFVRDRVSRRNAGKHVHVADKGR